jgi:hypothetical protein
MDQDELGRISLFLLFQCASLWCFEHAEFWSFEDSFEGRGDGNNTHIKLCIVKISAKIYTLLLQNTFIMVNRTNGMGGGGVDRKQLKGLSFKNYVSMQPVRHLKLLGHFKLKLKLLYLKKRCKHRQFVLM